MITITRPQAGDVRTFFRRALNIWRGIGPALSITTGPSGTRVRAKAADAAVGHLVPVGHEMACENVDLYQCGKRNRDMNTELLPRPLATSTDNLWSYISPSRLNCWLTCPLKWKLKYIDGIETPPTTSLFLGTIVHAALQHFYNHRQIGHTLNCGEVIEHVNDVWDPMVAGEEMVFESSAEETLLCEMAAGLVREYIAKLPADEPRPVAVEAKMEVPLVDPETGEDLGIPLLGFVDLVLDAPAGALIVDFKTSARSSKPLEISHEIQLSCYAWLYRQITGQSESGLEIRSLIKTKQPKLEFHRYPARTPKHFRRLFAAIRSYLDALDAGRFVYRPGWSCSCCDYRDTHCRNWCG